MVFRRTTDEQEWEIAAREQREFLKVIGARETRLYWHRALSAIEFGVLVIQFRGQALGILGSPYILQDIFYKWRGDWHREHTIEPELIEWATTAPQRTDDFNPLQIRAFDRPGLAQVFNELAATGSAAAVLRYTARRGILMPLAMLARLRQDAGQPSDWAERVTDWTRQVAGA